MAERILLVDYENVQAVDLGRIPQDVHIRFVLGAKQKTLPAELSMQAQPLGTRFEYVGIKDVQPNAVDFCIAFYLGETLTRNPKAECVVLSKDKKGFDPLVRHLAQERGLSVRRVNSLKEAFPASGKPSAAPSGSAKQTAARDHYERLLNLLKKEKLRPAKRKGVDNMLKSWFPSLSADDRQALTQRLFGDGHVREADGAVTYHL